MKIAFCLFSYFPFGGTQQDCLRVARACLERGHEIVILTSSWQGEKPAELPIEVLPTQGISRYTRNRNYVASRDNYLKQHPCNAVVGFDPMPGLDIYFAADPCYAEKALTQRHWLYRLTARFRQSMAYEKSVFSLESATQILATSASQMAVFKRYYETPGSRIYALPPGINRDRCASANAQQIRREMREDLGIGDGQWMLLSIGSEYKRKGIDRTLTLIASLPKEMRKNIQFWVIGQDEVTPFKKLAGQLRIANNVHFVPGSKDIPRILQAADLFLHPAYAANTDAVLLEALVAGVPEIVTDVCDYAHYVEEAQCGVVLTSPFNQAAYLSVLVDALYDSQQRARWRNNALRFAEHVDFFALPERAAEIIETILMKR